MNVIEIRSDNTYKKMASGSIEDKTELFREEILQPFEFKYKCIGAPLKADVPGGYDAVAVTVAAGGFDPEVISESHMKYIEQISNDEFWSNCTDSIKTVLQEFEKMNINLAVKDYIYTILLSDPDNPMAAYTGKACGDGGIPGYIIGTIIPDNQAIEAMPAVLAHETNHNVRWQFMKWGDSITLADMIISEGLAENQTAYLYGEEKTGQWVKNTDKETLESIVKPLIHEKLYETDFTKVSTYLYGDDIMKQRGGLALGVPYCAGYVCGYELVKYYLKKSGKNIYEATIMPTSEILKETEDFWK